MRKKLIELIREATDVVRRNGFECNASVMADYLLKNGVIVPPCKVGDKVYRLYHVSDAIPDFISDDVVTKIGVSTRGIMHEIGYSFDDFGKTVFLTKEEAEAALAERRKR